MLAEFTSFIRKYYQRPEGEIPLHEASISEQDYLQLKACLDSGIVSTVGSLVDEFEQIIANTVNAEYAVATNTGTAALHLALLCSGVQANDLVITQPFSFVASCNAIRYCGADPLFIDIDPQTLSLSVDALAVFLEEEAEVRDDGQAYHKASGRRISHCLPVCTFGHPPELDKIQLFCQEYNITLVVDAAEALGSSYQGKPAASWGDVAVLSFNGNKIMTSGGGGMLLTKHKKLAEKAYHQSVQARQQQEHHISYAAVGYNYRMPNLNAALGLAQLEGLKEKVHKLRQLAEAYHTFFSAYELEVLKEYGEAKSNYWLNALVFTRSSERDAFVQNTNAKGILTRPAWTLMNHLPMYQNCISTDLHNAEWAAQNLALLPSFPILKE